MVKAIQTPSPERVAIVGWVARMGAITAEALADRQGTSVASARSTLLAGARARLLSRRRPLVGQPALYTATRAGLRACGLRGFDPCRISASNALHSIACAKVAATLERCYPDHRVLGERELRRDERESGTALASACLGVAAAGAPLLHRPDLVLWPTGSDGAARRGRGRAHDQGSPSLGRDLPGLGAVPVCGRCALPRPARGRARPPTGDRHGARERADRGSSARRAAVFGGGPPERIVSGEA